MITYIADISLIVIHSHNASVHQFSLPNLQSISGHKKRRRCCPCMCFLNPIYVSPSIFFPQMPCEWCEQCEYCRQLSLSHSSTLFLFPSFSLPLFLCRHWHSITIYAISWTMRTRRETVGFAVQLATLEDSSVPALPWYPFHFTLFPCPFPLQPSSS